MSFMPTRSLAALVPRVHAMKKYSFVLVPKSKMRLKFWTPSGVAHNSMVTGAILPWSRLVPSVT